MQENNNAYRIRTSIGSDAPNVLNVHLTQTYDVLEVLSLKLTQTNDYKYYESSYGVIVGRVLANDAFGVPNAKVSVFISMDDAASIAEKGLYPFTSIRDADNNGVRYNLLPDEQVSACHQNVGTFPNKRFVLDNNDIIEVFDKYWKYTTVTNEAGDYMLFGIPTGDQQIHVDVDLSDIGVLSQRPRDMMYKGYNATLFESPNKFKQSRNLDSLSQIYSQNKGVYVYPYWGDTSSTEDTIAITRCDIQLEYKFEPTCVFMGCIITDQGENAIGKNCAAVENNGRMKNLTAGEGSIEMIRKTLDGKVEEFQIKGNRLIDSNGVWCYQIPMNLDYVKTDEFGNIVPTDNPNKGIPTRTRVRFRISLDETPNDAEARKRCRYLVPNNPTMDERDYPIFSQTKEFDYDFGTTTRDEDYKDLFWNKVYTVKNYIPRLQKGSKENNKKHTGIKAVNFFENNNPFPYNNLLIKLSFTYKIICVLVKFILAFVMMLNLIFSLITEFICPIYTAVKEIKGLIHDLGKTIILKPVTWPLEKILGVIEDVLDALMIECIGFGSDFCDDGINKVKYFLGCTKGCAWEHTKEKHNAKQASLPSSERETAVCLGITDVGKVNETTLFTCIEQQLAQDNDCVNFNFHNDWVNGALYAPLWYRRITPKKTFFFGLFRKKAKDQWCSADRSSGGTKLFQPCALKRQKSDDGEETTFINNDGKEQPIQNKIVRDCEESCISNSASVGLANGVIKTKETIYGQTVYYYQAGEYQQNLNNNKGEILTLFATDIVLLGSLNDCDIHGIPQFFKNLTSTTYNMPNNILVVDTDVEWNVDDNGNLYEENSTSKTEATGCDWGNTNKNDEYREDNDGGLFYGVGCLKTESRPKTCVNLSRICEYGVILDETKFIEDINSDNGVSEDKYMDNLLIPDGYISYDELMNIDERSMFATLNGNHLRTKLNKKNGLYEYDLRHYYVGNFDGSLLEDMMELKGAPNTITYKNNYVMEQLSKDYYHFRMGDKPFYYDRENRLPRYDNSFYFYFGIKPGSTAIEKFNSQFFSSCENSDDAKTAISIEALSNSWCSGNNDGYIKLDLNGITTPYDLTITNRENNEIYYTISNETNEKIYFSSEEKSFDGYKFIQLFFKETINNEDGTTTDIYEMPNGIYDLLIIEGDGIENEFEVSMNDKYITFNTSTQNFEIANNILLSENSNNNDNENKTEYCTIAEKTLENLLLKAEKIEDNETTIININPNDTETENITFLKEVVSDIGGTIGIYDVYSNNKPVYNLRITVESKNGFMDNDEKWFVTFDISVENNDNILTYVKKSVDGSCYNIDKIDNLMMVTHNSYTDSDGNKLPYFIIGVPKGNEDYNITVTQLCDENGKLTDTENSLTSSVKIEEPKPFKLYINDVDYDLIQNFKSGYTINGTEANTNGEEPIQWLNISNKDYYNWSANELYTIKHYTDMGWIESDAKDEVEKLQNEVINTMRSRFMLRCEGELFNLTFRVETDDMPYTLHVGYKEEEDGGYDYDHNIISDCQNVVEEILTINNIAIPTITSTDNKTFGNEINEKNKIPNNENKCYAVEPSSSCLKSPYFVAVVNSRGNTIPRSGIITSGDNQSRYDLVENNLNGYFGIHIIDKIMQLNIIAWAYMDKIPYYNPHNEELVGKTLTREGLLAGILYNGISTSDNVEAKFSEQTLGNENIEIETYTLKDGNPDEDAIPTKRVIKGKNNHEYTKYIIPNTIATNYPTYASVDKKDLSLTIQDETCKQTEDIYGKMSIVASIENTIIDSRDKNNLTLTVSAKNDGAETKYYAIPYKYDETNNKSNYIINEIGDGNINGYDDYYYMKHDFTEEDLVRMTQNSYTETFPRMSVSLKSEYPSDDNGEMISSEGWGTTGVFTVYDQSAIDKLPPYFIIAVSNITRCISPVYELYFYTAYMSLTKNGTEYTLSLSIEGHENGTNKSYYLTNYDYDVNVSANVTINDITIEMNYDFNFEKNTRTMSDSEKYNYENLYNNLNRLHLNGLFDVSRQTVITITDKSGLQHLCNLSMIQI